MIRYSSSVHKSDWECSSKSVRGSLFVNPLYIKNLTNLTNLTTLQTLQPYRFLCRVPKGPHVYLCTLHKGRLQAPCSTHNLCSLSENRGSRGAAGSPFRGLLGCIPARLHHTDLFCFGIKLGNFPKCGRSASNLHGSRPVRNDGLEPCEPSKIKRTHRSRSFWLPRRRNQSIQRFTVTQPIAHSVDRAG